MLELEALRRLKTGDMGGLEALVEAHQVKALRAAYLITQDRGSAQEVVQDAFLRLYRTIDRFDLQRPFEPYFMRIVVNAALQRAQRESRLVTLDDAEEWNALLADSSADPHDEVEAEALYERVRLALVSLTPTQRTAIVLRYYLNLTEEEMAMKLNIPRGTVKWRLHAARTHLGVLLRHLVKGD